MLGSLAAVPLYWMSLACFVYAIYAHSLHVQKEARCTGSGRGYLFFTRAFTWLGFTYAFFSYGNHLYTHLSPQGAV